MSFQMMSSVALLCLCRRRPFRLCPFFTEEEEEWADSNLSSLSLSNGNANVHPSGRACVRRRRRRRSGYFTEKGRQIEGGIQGGPVGFDVKIQLIYTESYSVPLEFCV